MLAAAKVDFFAGFADSVRYRKTFYCNGLRLFPQKDGGEGVSGLHSNLHSNSRCKADLDGHDEVTLRVGRRPNPLRSVPRRTDSWNRHPTRRRPTMKQAMRFWP